MRIIGSLIFMQLIGFSSNAQVHDSTSYTTTDSSKKTIREHDVVAPEFVAYTEGWNMIGLTQDNTTSYNFYYYKLLQVNASNDRYRSVIEVSVQGDDNYFQDQAVYLIAVTKYPNSLDRFDGLELRCILGNPDAATFYVFNDALWVKSNYKWGELYYRTVGDFYAYTPKSPITGGDYGQTITAPTGYLTSTSSYGLKCNFDNNAIYKLPYIDLLGNMRFDGNIGIGTTSPQSRLAVNGTITAKQVKVTQTGWPDYVFDSTFVPTKLSDIERYIKKNKRLPGIPSAKEVAFSGLDLGEMQQLQMKKIEELTLLLIEQSNKIRTLEQRIKQLEVTRPGKNKSIQCEPIITKYEKSRYNASATR